MQQNLIDITALAERLGVSERHVRRLVFERRVPYIKWGHLVRFDPADIDRWLHDARRGLEVAVTARAYDRAASPVRSDRAHR